MAAVQNGKRAENVLQEIRVVIPGTQALLGFQFIAFFNDAFKTLPASLQLYHLANLFLVSCSAVFLLTPVAYEEVGEDGKPTKRFISFTSRLIMLGMFCLITGMAGDVLVAGYALQSNHFLAAIAAIIIFLFGNIMWFGLSLAKRRS